MGGDYRKGSLSEAATLAFQYQSRPFVITPDINDSRISIIGSDVVGINISCKIKSSSSFFIFKKGLTGSLLQEITDTELTLASQIYILRFKDNRLKERFLKSNEFLNTLESLSPGMYFLNANSNILWHSSQNYREGIIEELNKFAGILDSL